jgi:hypothetical protein
MNAKRDMPTDRELATLFIDKLYANDNIIGDVRHVLMDRKKESTFHSRPP